MQLTIGTIETSAVFAALDQTVGRTVGLAVSGGGDSVAMTVMATEWARARGRRLAAITVDHGLRPEAASEAHAVAALCAEFGIPHTIATWSPPEAPGNIQDAARRTRQDLITDWAAQSGISDVCTGHTLDDQAETELMRLARGTGVDGLSGIAPRHAFGGLTWHRPILGQRRAVLRDYLTDQGIPWIDDPSNQDRKYDRVRIRQALDVLEPLGITPTGLADTADRLRTARHALDDQTVLLAQENVRMDRGDLILSWERMAKSPPEILRRLLSEALRWIAGSDYGPRAGALGQMKDQLDAAQPTVLNGCLITPEGTARRISREFQAVRGTRGTPEAAWDGRWVLSGPARAGLELRALGEAGLRACPDWRDAGLPRASLIASPAVWEGERLIAAPLAGFVHGWRAQLAKGRNDFCASLITH